jgi:hypothetical protein
MHNMNALVNCKLCYMLDKMQVLGFGPKFSRNLLDHVIYNWRCVPKAKSFAMHGD